MVLLFNKLLPEIVCKTAHVKQTLQIGPSGSHPKVIWSRLVFGYMTPRGGANEQTYKWVTALAAAPFFISTVAGISGLVS